MSAGIYEVIIKVEICDCEDKQEAIAFVKDNVGLSEFNLEIEARVMELTDNG